MNQKDSILIVDDDESTCRSLALIFGKKGYDTETTKTAQGALEKAQKRFFNAALIDIRLPDMDGTILLNKIKKVNPEMVCIIITGHASLQNAMTTIKIGTNGYFVKPLIIEDVISRIEEGLSKQHLKRELNESEEKYRTLYESVKDGIGFSDMEGNFLDANHALLDMLGYRIEEIKKLTYQKLTPKKWHEMEAEIVKNQIMARGYSEEFEKEYIKKDGTVFPITIRTWLLKDKKGKLVGTWAIIRDITERKQAEEALHKALAQANEGKRTLDALMEQVPEGITIADAPDVRIRMVSRYGRELTGKSKEILEGITVDKHTEQWDIYCSDGVTPAKNEDLPLTRATQKGELVKDEEWVLGNQFNERIPILCNAGPIRDEVGNITGGVIAWRDITERKLAEENVKNAKDELQMIMDSVPAMIFYKDIEGRIIRVNKTLADTFKLPIKDIEGKTPEELFPREQAEKMRKDDKEVVISGKPKRDIIQPYDTLEGTRWSITDMIPYKDKKGKVTGVVSLSKDITVQKKSEEELKQSYQKLKKTMEDAIYTIGKVAETRDPYTAGHQKNVSQLATFMAQEMKLHQDRIEGVRIASLVHDIGKISIPSEILSKPNRLNEIEYNLIKDHSQIGYDILKSIEFPYPVARIVLQHHERLNGSGYPNNLKGDKIMLEARIIGVADVVEAISSHRPYRPALGIDKALEEISQNKDILYDPKVVDACMKLFKEKRFKF